MTSAPKMTPSMRDALVVCAAKLLRPFSFHNGVPSFYQQSRFSGIPTLKAPTPTVRSLVRQGLIEVDRETCVVTLTDQGRALLETILTDDERKALARVAEEEAALHAYLEKRDRKEKWIKDTENERRVWREQADRLWAAIHADAARIQAIGWMLGRGANNVDELIAELRECATRHDRNKAAVEEHHERQPTFDDGSTF